LNHIHVLQKGCQTLNVQPCSKRLKWTVPVVHSRLLMCFIYTNHTTVDRISTANFLAYEIIPFLPAVQTDTGISINITLPPLMCGTLTHVKLFHLAPQCVQSTTPNSIILPWTGSKGNSVLFSIMETLWSSHIVIHAWGSTDKNRHLGHNISFVVETPWTMMNESNYNYNVINVLQKKGTCTNTYEQICTGMPAGRHACAHTLPSFKEQMKYMQPVKWIITLIFQI